jgi:hypothetical protein
LIEKLKLEEPNLYSLINDLNYNIKIKNKDENRSQRLIFFGLKNNLLILKNNCSEYFIDKTFKIIPKAFRPYKLFVLSDINKENKTPF